MIKPNFEEMKRLVDEEFVIDKSTSWYPQFINYLKRYGWEVSDYTKITGHLVMVKKY